VTTPEPEPVHQEIQELLGVEFLRLPPQIEEDLLGDLLGRRIAAQDAPGQ
jgi:hypothetical protein